MLCDDPDGRMGWGGAVGGMFKREVIYVCLELIHIVIQQKLTQHCKTIIFYLKKLIFKRQYLRWWVIWGHGNLKGKQVKNPRWKNRKPHYGWCIIDIHGSNGKIDRNLVMEGCMCWPNTLRYHFKGVKSHWTWLTVLIWSQITYLQGLILLYSV